MKCKNCGFDYGDQKFCPACAPTQPLSNIGVDHIDNPSEVQEVLPPDQPTIIKGEES